MLEQDDDAVEYDLDEARGMLQAARAWLDNDARLIGSDSDSQAEKWECEEAAARHFAEWLRIFVDAAVERTIHRLDQESDAAHRAIARARAADPEEGRHR